MTPLVPLLALASLLHAGDNSSGAWGIDYKERINEVYNKVRLSSVYSGRGDMADQPMWFPKQTGRDSAGNPVYGQMPGVFDGAGALAFAPHIGLNDKGDKPLVVATNQLPEIAHSVDEVAFVMAHEFAHLEKGHPQKLDAKIKELFNKWSDAKDPDYWNNTPSAQVQKEFREAKGASGRTNAEELAAFQSQMEDEADLRGRELMKTAGFNEDGAPKLLQHANEWMSARLNAQQLAALKKQVQDHRPPDQRAKTMADENAGMCLNEGPCK
jgi:hypothetical protein